MVSAGAGRYKSPRHFVHFVGNRKIIRFNVTDLCQWGLDSPGETPDIKGVKPSTHHQPARPRRPRSRYGYDHRWWGESPPVEPEDPSYWSTTRRPLPALLFILPVLLAYEAGVIWLGGPSADALRAGADAWVRQGLAALGFTDRWLLPVGLVVGLLGWQAVDRHDWRFPPAVLWGMAVESLLLAVALVGLSKLVDLGFSRLEGSSLLATRHPIAPVIGFLGAGLYEEALFRLALIPLIYKGLR
jgi:hypothetical protein